MNYDINILIKKHFLLLKLNLLFFEQHIYFFINIKIAKTKKRKKNNTLMSPGNVFFFKKMA